MWVPQLFLNGWLQEKYYIYFLTKNLSLLIYDGKVSDHLWTPEFNTENVKICCLIMDIVISQIWSCGKVTRFFRHLLILNRKHH